MMSAPLTSYLPMDGMSSGHVTIGLAFLGTNRTFGVAVPKPGAACSQNPDSSSSGSLPAGVPVLVVDDALVVPPVRSRPQPGLRVGERLARRVQHCLRRVVPAEVALGVEWVPFDDRPELSHVEELIAAVVEDVLDPDRDPFADQATQPGT